MAPWQPQSEAIGMFAVASTDPAWVAPSSWTRRRAPGMTFRACRSGVGAPSLPLSPASFTSVAGRVAFGKLYVCGGQGGFWSDAHLSSVEIFDPQSGLWQSFAVSLAEVSGDEAGAPAGAAPLADERRNAAAATVAV
mmetsp:Transcript_152018/g.488084  ORF Transcript_152018/g.488084 Transcript_152018/m.488084 type:complete len:137 (-) Transcript_152018:68-478(-)